MLNFILWKQFQIFLKKVPLRILGCSCDVKLQLWRQLSTFLRRWSHGADTAWLSALMWLTRRSMACTHEMDSIFWPIIFIGATPHPPPVLLCLVVEAPPAVRWSGSSLSGASVSPDCGFVCLISRTELAVLFAVIWLLLTLFSSLPHKSTGSGSAPASTVSTRIPGDQRPDPCRSSSVFFCTTFLSHDLFSRDTSGFQVCAGTPHHDSSTTVLEGFCWICGFHFFWSTRQKNMFACCCFSHLFLCCSNPFFVLFVCFFHLLQLEKVF